MSQECPMAVVAVSRCRVRLRLFLVITAPTWPFWWRRRYSSHPPAPTAPSIWPEGGRRRPARGCQSYDHQFSGLSFRLQTELGATRSPRAGVTAGPSRLPPVACWPRVTGSDENAGQAADGASGCTLWPTPRSTAPTQCSFGRPRPTLSGYSSRPRRSPGRLDRDLGWA